MSSIRSLTTYLALAALLFSNVAGWFHVGCVSAGHQKADGVGRVTHSCGCDRHCQRNVVPASQESPSANNSLPNQDHDSGEPHDSGSCSICNNFFASRDLVVSTEMPILWTPLLVDRLRVDSGVHHVEQILLSELSVRGPPRV